MLRAAQLAVNQINAKGGVRGRALELRIADDSGSEDTAVRVAERLYADQSVVAVVGHLTSTASIAAARVYGGGATPVAMISPAASSPALSGMSPYVFRVCPSDLQHGPRLAHFAWQTLLARRAGIIYLNNEYGRGIRGTFAAEFTSLGGTVVEADPYVTATPSLEPYLSRMRREGVDVLVLAGERPGAELALREMRALGLRWPVMGETRSPGSSRMARWPKVCASRPPICPTVATTATPRSWRSTPGRSRDSVPITAAPGPTTPSCSSREPSTTSAATVGRSAPTWHASATAGRRSTASPGRSRSTPMGMCRARRWRSGSYAMGSS